MSDINIELKLGSSSGPVSHIVKSGNTYVVYVSESFDVNDRHNLQDLIDKLNLQLKADGIEEVEARRIDRELKRLSIGRRISIRID